jgi:NADP-dependent 3-hydroxy acid dehydrogenase YdfG
MPSRREEMRPTQAPAAPLLRSALHADAPVEGISSGLSARQAYRPRLDGVSVCAARAWWRGLGGMIGRMHVDQRRVALVTGSSRGLGAAIARRLARDGLAVAVNGRGGDAPVDEVARSISAQGGTTGALAGDVTDEQDVAVLVAAISASLGPAEVLVLNATGPQPEAPLADVAWEGHLAQLEFFVKSPVLLGRAVLAGMQARQSGRIIQIDSEVADRPPPGRSAYATAKSAQAARPTSGSADNARCHPRRVAAGSVPSARSHRVVCRW